jgi:hypothetical protein
MRIDERRVTEREGMERLNGVSGGLGGYSCGTSIQGFK